MFLSDFIIINFSKKKKIPICMECFLFEMESIYGLYCIEFNVVLRLAPLLAEAL